MSPDMACVEGFDNRARFGPTGNLRTLKRFR